MSSDIEVPPIREDGLQLSEDRPLQRKLWIGQRVAWLAFGVVLFGAMLGLTGGGGYLARQTIDFRDGTVDMPRIARWQSSDAVRIELTAASPVEVVLGPGFGESLTIENIAPKPRRSRARASGLSMVFDVAGEGTKKVFIAVRPDSPGWVSFDVTVAGERRSASILILP